MVRIEQPVYRSTDSASFTAGRPEQVLTGAVLEAMAAPPRYGRPGPPATRFGRPMFRVDCRRAWRLRGGMPEQRP